MKETICNIKKVWPYLKKQKLQIILYAFVNFLSIIVSLIVPILSAKIIVDLTSNNLLQVIYMSLIILFIEILSNVFRYFTQMFAQIIYREGFKSLQIDLGSEILKIENSTLDKTSSGTFIQRLTDDTSKIADVFFILYDNLTNIITDIGIFGAIFIINKIAFVYILFTVVSIYLLDKKRIDIRTNFDKEYRKKKEKMYGFVGELVRGTRDIKMLNCEDSFVRELKNNVIDINKQKYKMDKANRNYHLFIYSYEDTLFTGLIILLVYFVYNKEITVAMALAIYNYSGRITSIIYYFSGFFEGIKSFDLSSSRVFAIINGKDFPKEVFGSNSITKVNGDFEFRNVSFGYNEKMVLDNINFKIHANETVSFVGKSGSGKSTIFSLLCKMYDNYTGDILIDGMDIKTLTKDTIRGNITIISQNPYIFNMSIKDNFRLVKKDVTLKEIKEACNLACLSDFIESLPEKYDTIIGEGGINLSGGERQRLAIARALIQKTEIILFDEATSALDNETQAKIQKAIESLKKDYTILIIAHRLSTVVGSDRIMFLSDGKIKCAGTHDELIKNSKEYKDLYEAELLNKEN